MRPRRPLAPRRVRSPTHRLKHGVPGPYSGPRQLSVRELVGVYQSDLRGFAAVSSLLWIPLAAVARGCFGYGSVVHVYTVVSLVVSLVMFGVVIPVMAVYRRGDL